MPFNKLDVEKTIEEKMKDPEFKKLFEAAEKMYDLKRRSKDRFATSGEYADIVKFVITRRNNLGLTQKQLADKVSMKQQVVSRFENGKSLASIETVNRILGGLDCKLKIKIVPKEL